MLPVEVCRAELSETHCALALPRLKYSMGSKSPLHLAPCFPPDHQFINRASESPTGVALGGVRAAPPMLSKLTSVYVISSAETAGIHVGFLHSSSHVYSCDCYTKWGELGTGRSGLAHLSNRIAHLALDGVNHTGRAIRQLALTPTCASPAITHMSFLLAVSS